MKYLEYNLYYHMLVIIMAQISHPTFTFQSQVMRLFQEDYLYCSVLQTVILLIAHFSTCLNICEKKFRTLEKIFIKHLFDY